MLLYTSLLSRYLNFINSDILKMLSLVVNVEGKTLAMQHLKLCQILASKGKHFNITNKVGNTFIFSLDTMDKVQARR